MTRQTRMSVAEFVALMAMMFATIAFSIDSMLPALPEIGAELSPGNLNRAQLILTAFVVGMGVGTFFTGPLSDTFGRKPVILAGAALYVLASALAWAAQSLELVLAARALQGLGAAGPRVVAMAVVRDLYEGRQMARLMSIVMVIFTVVPAVAPAMGAAIIAFSGWRGLFMAFILFAVFAALWMGLRLEETLPPDQRRPFRLAVLWQALVELMAHRVVRIAIAVQTLCFAMLFALLSSVQPIFDQTFGQADSFPFWFGAIAIISASASVVNAALVVRLGMRFLVTLALAVQLVLTGAMLALELAGVGGGWHFAAFLFWQTSLFFQTGMTVGNLNAMAMEPMGHIAGLAASVIGGVATVGAMVFAVPIGLAFDGSALPLALGLFALTAVALLLMLVLRRLEAPV